ncbi:LacI family DNA-binding transcriptional regulator [Carboxylicivirga mesophila]|uniref:LacI family DNA-binding transcriptional regulator n=1 Tax=Carboxylicivirga mesophila TaxID=1166478 RepID=A0ABS5K797_9BACT|nr:LacI family DNA-binding transcriptional regulator [Carboxylicivirga mesophila]MBS2210870.1 LacI family DNA-binding transcriptional regulator [Carboxylicivirga mesophila]
MSPKEKKGEITINDIAKELNISPSTVSRALNDNAKISEATKNKVKAVAKDLGYELNLVASSLSKNKTNVIGVIIPHLGSQFFAKALSGIQEVARDNGYNVIISQTNESVQQEVEMTRVMNSARVDGLVCCLTMETDNVDHFNVFVKKSIPVAMFDRVSYAVPGPKIVVDNYEAGYVATEHLINLGCKRIAHLAGAVSSKVFEERSEGFKDALKKNSLPLLSQFLLSSDLTEQDARDAVRLWMNLPQRPDGIVAASASSGLIIASAVKAMGIKLPEELSIISLGNERCNEFVTPSLSAVDMPGYEMGKAAVTQLIKCINDGVTDSSITLKPIQLLIRNSSFKH